jgi:hypothetical protein
MEKLYRGPYIDAYCQAWFHLAKLFQRRRLKYEKFNGRTLSDGNISHDGYLAGSIYVRSSIKLLHLVPFGQQTWPPRLILFSDWLMLKKSSYGNFTPLFLFGLAQCKDFITTIKILTTRGSAH